MPIEEEAHRRSWSNRFSRTNRPIEDDAEALGLAGELAFARLVGIEDYEPKRNRKRYQFTVSGFTVKITTSKTPGHLFVKSGAVDADIYVLAGCAGTPKPESVFWCGWANRPDVQNAPVTSPSHRGDYNVDCHTLPRADLSPMADLMMLLGIDTERLRNPGTTTPPVGKKPDVVQPSLFGDNLHDFSN